MEVREISRRQFDAYCYARQPMLRIMSEEVAWFEAKDRKLLAAIILDKIDGDYGSIILGRDARKLFRCIAVSKEFHPTATLAIDGLAGEISPYLNDGQDFYPQGDEVLPTNEIFSPVVSEEKLHPYFLVLTQEERFEAARNIIREIAYSFIDVDGNYLQQFQTTAFDARLWEMFLHVLFYNAGFEFDRSQNAPDFWLKKLGYECFVEAVTVGSSEGFDAPHPKSSKDIVELSKDYLPIKYGSPLFKKISRKNPYWEMPHVKDKPFVLAIHDYHLAAEPGNPGSMTWSRAGLFNYLYGIRDIVEFDDAGNAIQAYEELPTGRRVKTEKIKEHKYKDKVIPSYFFGQENAENVSAVLFSNGATITTFNRMGKLAGLGSENVKMMRMGVKANPDPNQDFPLPFSINVDDPSYEEAWSDTVIMYHNPHALIPFEPEAFPEITHVFYNPDSEEFMVIQNPNEVISSTTVVLTTKKDSAA